MNVQYFKAAKHPSMPGKAVFLIRLIRQSQQETGKTKHSEGKPHSNQAAKTGIIPRFARNRNKYTGQSTRRLFTSRRQRLLQITKRLCRIASEIQTRKVHQPDTISWLLAEHATYHIFLKHHFAGQRPKIFKMVKTLAFHALARIYDATPTRIR